MATTSSAVREWLLTGVLVMGLLGGALWLRNHKQTVPALSLVTEPNLLKIGAQILSLTTYPGLDSSKLGSLESYNQKIPEETYLRIFALTAGAIKATDSDDLVPWGRMRLRKITGTWWIR